VTVQAAPTSDAATPRAAAGAPLRRGFIIRDYGILVALVAIVIALSLGTSTFLTTGNIINLLDQCAVVGLLATGATVCILSGVFDLTASASLALSAIVGVQVTRHTNVLTGFLAAVVAGAVLGFITGNLVVYPLASQQTDFGMLTWPSLFGLTSATILFIVVVLVIGIVIAATTFGRRVYAVGGNAEAARLSGIRVGSIHVAVYVISGICSALAGLILASRAGSAQSSMATGLELTAIAAAVIGGTSILGGEGAVWRGVVGALLLTLIGNGFNLLGWNTIYQQVTQGVLILLAVALDRWLRRRSR
jgi:ribose transport system permease protein